MAGTGHPYSEKLKVALECEGWSVNRLSKELATRTGNAVETERSALRGYLRGSTPRPERARLIADIMEIPELALVENPRLSGAARLEDRLERVETLLADVLENQVQALSTQTAMLAELEARNAELQQLRGAVESLTAAARTAPKRSTGRR